MKNETVKTFIKKFDETREQTIDTDAVLPDYYPEVNRIIKCTSVLSTESVTNAGDKLSIAGAARTDVIFIGSDERLHVFETTQKYTKLMQCDGIADGDRFFVSQEVTQLNFKATAPRRIEIHASVAVRAAVFSIGGCEYVSDFEDSAVEQLCESFESYAVESADFLSFEISDTVKVPDGVTSESELISSSGEIFIRETKVIKNKIMIKGNCTAEFVTAQADGSIKKFGADIPFTEVKEMYGAEENDICNISASCKNIRLGLKSLNGGNEVTFSADAEAYAFTIKKADNIVAVDAFSVKGETKISSSAAAVLLDTAAADTTTTVSLDADTYDDAPSELLAAFADNIRYGTSEADGGCKLNGTCTVNAVLRNSDGKMYIIGRTASFECDLPTADEWFISVSCSSINAKLTENGKAAFSASFSVKGFGFVLSNKICISDCHTVDGSETFRDCGIALYYAHPGEKLWDIAKENKCRLSVLKEMNEITAEETNENKVLIFPVGV